MKESLRNRLEQAALSGVRFSPSPAWFFVFLEQCAITEQLFSMIPNMGESPCEAVVAFAKRTDVVSANDASAALNRMLEVSMAEAKVSFSEELTLFFSTDSSRAIRDAFGVPADAVCVGALRFAEGKTESAKEETRWNVFSYIRP